MKIEQKIKYNLTILWDILKWLGYIMLTVGIVIGAVYLMKFIFG